jgi:MFS family permease
MAMVGAGRAMTHRYVAALAYADFRRMWLANVAAQAAAWALIVARGWLVFDVTHSSAWVGVTTFAAMGPLFVVPPFAGVLADRVDRRTVLAWTYALNLAHNLALALLALFDLLALWQLVALSLFNGVVRATQMPVSQALAANLVPRHALLNALSLNAATQHGARLVGPGLATPLLAVLGAPAAFFLCTAFYAVGWLQILRIRTRSVGGVQAGESVVQNFVDGLRYTFGVPLIRAVLVLVLLHCALTMAFESTLPGFSHEHLGAHQEDGFGYLMVGVGLGGLLGSLSIGGVTSALVRGRLLLAMGVLSGLGQVALATTHTLAPAFLAATVMGASQAAFMTMSQAITQSLAEDTYRGRLASINTFSLGGMMSLMNLFNGFFAGHFGAAPVLIVNGALFVLVMGLSVLAITPRRVYARGIPAEAHAA